MSDIGKFCEKEFGQLFELITLRAQIDQQLAATSMNQCETGDGENIIIALEDHRDLISDQLQIAAEIIDFKTRNDHSRKKNIKLSR